MSSSFMISASLMMRLISAITSELTHTFGISGWFFEGTRDYILSFRIKESLR